MVKKRKIFSVFLAVVSLMFSLYIHQTVTAQEFPSKQVTMVSPFEAGGAFDLAGRAMASVAIDYLGQPLYILLKPGGAGAIGTDFVANAAPDGYTLLWASQGPNAILPAVLGRSKGPEHFEPVCQIYSSPMIVVAYPNAPFKTLKEMIDWAKANPRQLVFGSTGAWGGSDLAWKQMTREIGIEAKVVPHSGGGPLLLALIGGHVQASIMMTATSLTHVKAEKVRGLAILDNKRHTELPDVPTAQECGVNIVSNLWAGFAAPKNTPRPIVDKLAGAFLKITQNESFQTIFGKLGEKALYRGPDEFGKFWWDEYKLYQELGKIFKK